MCQLVVDTSIAVSQLFTSCVCMLVYNQSIPLRELHVARFWFPETTPISRG
jgi:hypothetical protein